MIVIPALDVHSGSCVQAGCVPDIDGRTRLADPILAARHWAASGFARIHVSDLDAAEGDRNVTVVNGVLRENVTSTQVDIGVGGINRVDDAFANGASLVAIAVTSTGDLGWIKDAADAWPDAVLATLAVRDDRVVVPNHRAGMRATAMIEELSAIALAGVVLTATTRRGLRQGADVRLMAEAVQACTLPLYAAGGVGTRRHLDELADCGVVGAIVGTALYSGAIDAGLLAEEYSGSA